MRPQVLLDHFERITNAPDAIPRLRRFILDLAVRGKLVDQNADDEPASKLLKNTQVKRSQPAAGETIKQSVNGDVPFEIPSNWIWAPLGNICSKTGSGSTPRGGKSVYQRDGVPFLRSQNVYDDGLRLDDVAYISIQTHERMSATAVVVGDLLLNITGGSIGRCCLVPNGLGQANVSQHVAIIRVAVDGMQRYLHRLILSPYFQSFVLNEQTGAGRGGLPKNRMDRIPVALPPQAEQQRIVGKVDELMALCDFLERAQEEREKRRDRVVAASLHHLNNGVDSAALRQHADFYLNHLQRLTTRPDEIYSLRQTILNLAVRGRLVSQDTKDEPASELLKRIRAEKAQLAEERVIKKPDSMTLPTGSEFPFPLPRGWTSSNLQSLCISVTDGDHLPPPKADRGIPFLVIGNVRSQTLNFAGCRHVTEEYYRALDVIRRPRQGDILYTLVGSYGIPVMVTDDRQFCVQRHIGILRPSPKVNARFLSRTLESKLVFDQATTCATGIAQKTVPLAGLRGMVIPLPPLAEQHRIVAKVDELMALCDRLDDQLVTTQTDSCRFLDAVLNQALNGSRAPIDGVVNHR